MWEDGGTYAEGWNFGPNDEDARPVSWITEQLTRLWGDGASWQLDTKVNPHEATYLKLDCSKAKSRLKWQPKLDLGMTLEWIVEWYQAYMAEQDMQQLTAAQIQRYSAL
jgi:CDP-glucose 4,6-dehydratase